MLDLLCINLVKSLLLDAEIKMGERLLVIGTGCGGTELAFAARAGGWEGEIVLVGDEPALPYHRPPLSKAYLSGQCTLESISLKTAAAFEKSAIDLRCGTPVAAIDRASKRVALEDGNELAYDRLALALGGQARRLPAAQDGAEEAENFHYLRTLADCEAIRSSYHTGQRLVIVGAGYIGLEVAAAAVKSGLRVTVLEAASRVLARVTAPLLSEFYESIHRQAGVDVRTGEQVESFELTASGDRVSAVCCASGEVIPADIVIAGIGLVPNTELAFDAGVDVEDGVLVDEVCRTSDQSIFAAGDCTRFYSALYGRYVRLESVPNALEQARIAATALCGKPLRKEIVPWFWSDQYDLNLKMVGLSEGYDRLVLRGSLESRAFSAFYLLGDRVLAVDTVNRPVEFNLSKRLIGERIAVDAEALGDDAVPFKDLLAASGRPG